MSKTVMIEQNEDEDLLKAKNICFRLLKYRLRSEQELRDKLKAKNLPTPIAEQTIAYFKDLELVDDRVFARQWTASRLKKPYGFSRIRLELQKKGISKEIIKDILNDVQSQYDEGDIVAELAIRRASQYRNIDPEKVQQRVFGYLIRRGFTAESAIRAIKQL